MIREAATVVRVEGARVHVETLQKSACGHCAARQECPNGALAEMGSQRTCQIEVTGMDGLQPGDRVEIGLQEETLMAGALTLYVLPLLGLLVGVGVADAGHASELWQLAAGAGGFALGLSVARRASSKAQPEDLMPRILRKL